MSDIPPPDRDARTWATLAHLGGFGFVAFGLGQIIIPLIIWLLKRDDHPFVDDQASEALNFQLSITLYMVIAGAFFCLGLGPVVWIILGVIDVVLIIVAATQANAGRRYRYPMTLRFI